MYGLFFCWIFQPIVNIFYHMYDQIPIFIIRQKTAAPFLMRQLLLLHILYFTIISQVRTMLPAFTVMTAVPFLFAVTFPFALTVATFLFELL